MAGLLGGSSPRGRGTPRLHRHRIRRLRFIPARAGNTFKTPAKAISISVHPRAGGEHRMTPVRAWRATGSSPRGRGTRRRPEPRAGASRFIPARAGNTSPAGSARSPSTVHPRAGGEHAEVFEPVTAETGSSPRGRGTPRMRLSDRATVRFIPARAGNTGRSRAMRSHRSVHPRAGGEHGGHHAIPSERVGSSPRWRVAGISIPGECQALRGSHINSFTSIS